MLLHDQSNVKFSIKKKPKFSRFTWPQEAWKRQQTPNPPAHPPTNQSLSTQIHQEINPNQGPLNHLQIKHFCNSIPTSSKSYCIKSSMNWFGLKQETPLFWVKMIHLQPGPPFSCTQSRCSRSRSTRCGCCNQNWETWRENDTFGKREQAFRNLVNLFSKTMTICMASILRGSISGKWNYYIHKDLIQQ